MDGRGNEGHTESQPRKNIPLRKQSYKLSHPGDFDVAVSTALLKDSALEDNPVSNSLIYPILNGGHLRIVFYQRLTD